ncbi:hypothetical protein FOZ60_016382 [Perkinsus olseni]|uniref:Uncharacterized protein n=1 Tax=Perkinsus olseni TaxID=32597 RepID=A0A7J6P4H9_PEROL|nr:hypothetical protein FOZ60_016382 [Perkinsus olseni]
MSSSGGGSGGGGGSGNWYRGHNKNQQNYPTYGKYGGNRQQQQGVGKKSQPVVMNQRVQQQQQQQRTSSPSGPSARAALTRSLTSSSSATTNEPVADRMSELKRKLVESRGGLTADLSAMQPSAESAAKIPKVAARGGRGSITTEQSQQVHIHPRRGGGRGSSATPKKSSASSPSHGVPKAGVRAPAKVGKQIRVQHPPPPPASIVRTGSAAVAHGVHLAKHKPQTTPSPPPPKATAHPMRRRRGTSPAVSEGSGSSDAAVAPPTMPVPLLSTSGGKNLHQHHKAVQPKSSGLAHQHHQQTTTTTPKSKPDDGKLLELIPAQVASSPPTLPSSAKSAPPPVAAHKPTSPEVPSRGTHSAVSRLRTIEHLRAKRAQQQISKEHPTPKVTPSVAAPSTPKPAATPLPPPPVAAEKTVPKPAPKSEPTRPGFEGGEQSLTERMLEAVLSQLIDTHSQWLVEHCGVEKESLQPRPVDVTAMDLCRVEQMVLDETANFETKLKASSRYLDAVRPVLDQLPKLTPAEEESFGLHQKSKPPASAGPPAAAKT